MSDGSLLTLTAGSTLLDAWPWRSRAVISRLQRLSPREHTRNSQQTADLSIAILSEQLFANNHKTCVETSRGTVVGTASSLRRRTDFQIQILT